MKQRKRIESYLDSLVDKSLPIEQQSLILSVDTNLIGSGENGTCHHNYSSGSCGDKNTNLKCTNYGDACTGSSNGECSNPPANICTVNSCATNIHENQCGGA